MALPGDACRFFLGLEVWIPAEEIILETQASSIVANFVPEKLVKVWAVFFLCLVFSGIGVALSFFVLGATISGYRLWGVALVIAVTMLGISYGAKYANPDARESFTPVDLIQYLTQGFLWPSTWPALADFVGIDRISPPTEAALGISEAFAGLMLI